MLREAFSFFPEIFFSHFQRPEMFGFASLRPLTPSKVTSTTRKLIAGATRAFQGEGMNPSRSVWRYELFSTSNCPKEVTARIARLSTVFDCRSPFVSILLLLQEF
jgi:hypothetical protein